MLGCMSLAPNVRDLLEGHIGLELESIDRLYHNGYVPQLQHGAGLVGFLCRQRGKPIASPALLGQITGRFIAEVKALAKEQGIPLFHFERNESKDQRALRLETGAVLRAAGGASISPGADSYECATNWIQCPIEQSAPNHRYRTGSISCSGVSRSQSCLKNPAHLSNFFW